MEISETLKMTELIIKTKCIMSTNLASCHFFFYPCIQVWFNVCLTFLRTVQKIHISFSLSYFQSKTK